MNLIEEVKHCEEVHKPSRDALLTLGKYKVGVEIGVQYGINAESLLENGIVEKLYGIDPFDTNVDEISPLRNQDNEIYQYTMKRLERFGDRYVHIKKTSNDAIYDIKEPIDFIYIDGSNKKQATYDDISLWYPKVREGGLVTGHNYNHPSFKYIKEVVDSYFGVPPYTGNGYLWWFKRQGGFDPLRKVSIVTPFYNAHYFIADYMKNLEDERISEVITVDDHSDIPLDIYVKGKFKVVRNEENMGEFKTRIRGAELATSDWVIFLDNDNSITNDYLDKIFNIPRWRDDVIYHPDFGNKVKINYRSLGGNYIGLPNIGKYLRENKYLMSMFLNTGNFFMNRKKYLEVAKPISDIDKHAYGDVWFNYHWMKNNGKIFVVPGMEYVHRRHKHSAWKYFQKKMQPVMDQVVNDLWNS